MCVTHHLTPRLSTCPCSLFPTRSRWRPRVFPAGGAPSGWRRQVSRPTARLHRRGLCDYVNLRHVARKTRELQLTDASFCGSNMLHAPGRRAGEKSSGENVITKHYNPLWPVIVIHQNPPFSAFQKLSFMK